jgi:hypothetical protein
MTPEDKIDELESALTANDEYLKELQAHNAELLKGGIELQARYEVLKELNAELLEWLKHARLFVAQPTASSTEIDRVIAKAEGQE